MKKRKSILSLFPVGATHYLLSSLMLWVAVPGAEYMPQHNSFMKECAMMPAPLLLSKRHAGAPPSSLYQLSFSRRFSSTSELFKDPQRNGHRTPEQIVEHMHTPLVLSGWSPGDGRTPVPIPQRVSSSRKCKHGQKKELHVPWGKRRNLPRCPGLNSDQFR
jgi:hypothetical protein